MKKLILLSFIVAVALFASQVVAQEPTFKARVSSVTSNSVVIYLDGWAAARSGESYTLYRNDGTGDTRLNVGTASFWRDTMVPTGKTYTYRLTKTPGGVIGTASVNATVRPGTIVKGVGWSSMDSAGIGWISINSSSQEPGKGSHSPVPYGVYADDSGIMHGVMWAGHVSGNPPTGWGWLSFNQEDLKNCPDSNCRAFLNPATGKIDGWGKFINTAGVTDSWSGWVNLRSGTSYGLCFGDPDGTPIEIDKKAYLSGGTCKANGGANHPVLTGVAWAGLNAEEPGGWILFASSSLGIINPTSTLNQVLIQPDPPHNVAIRDIKKFWANRPVAWFVDNTYGGNDRYGTVRPTLSGDGQLVDYLAPKTLPFPSNTTIKASTTEPLNPGVDQDPLTVIPPYAMVWLPEGQTSIRLIITKNYKDPNYFGREPHHVYVRGEKKTPPGVVVASSTTGNIGSFAHTGLEQKKIYYYELETIYSDNYKILTPIISCQTGATPTPLGTATNLNAYANTSRSIIVNWKDNSRSTSSYEFELQRMKITPDRDLRLAFQATGATKVNVNWENKTLWVPYTQKLLRSDNGGATFSPVLGQVLGWPYGEPPTSTIQYTFSDAVALGTSYQYKLQVCANLDLTDLYSAPARGGTAKEPIVCVESPVFNYLHSWGGGEGRAPGLLTEATASLLNVSQKTLRAVWNVASGAAEKIADGFRATVRSVAELLRKDKGGVATAATPTYDAYFKPAVITKNPAYRDEELGPDTVYLYRVSILSEEPIWSNYRAGKTLKNDEGSPTENRPVCMRNSFCDSSITGVQSGDLSESSEQQCFVNKDCVNIGRSDQGFQER